MLGPKFINRVFTKKEILLCNDRHERYAILFSIKESIMKAIGTGWANGVNWKQIESVALDNLKVEVQLNGKALSICRNRNVNNIVATFKLTKQFVVTTVLLEN